MTDIQITTYNQFHMKIMQIFQTQIIFKNWSKSPDGALHTHTIITEIFSIKIWQQILSVQK